MIPGPNSYRASMGKQGVKLCVRVGGMELCIIKFASISIEKNERLRELSNLIN